MSYLFIYLLSYLFIYFEKALFRGLSLQPSGTVRGLPCNYREQIIVKLHHLGACSLDNFKHRVYIYLMELSYVSHF